MKVKQFAVWSAVFVSVVGMIVWQLAFKNVNFYIICAAMLVLSMLPFLVRFERRQSAAREIALTATMIALAVVSRAAFYLIPQVKPIAAVVIVAAVCLGAERGYLIGAFSAFISNFLFGQGYWTPFQMAALGAVGLLAGLLLKKANRWVLAVGGFLLAFAVYGVIVDLSTVLVALGNRMTLSGVLSIYAAGVPFSFVFGISTAVFLFLFGEVFIKKLNRVIIKYHILPLNRKNTH